MISLFFSDLSSCFFVSHVSLFLQTGSGKTFTMLGEIEDLELKPSPNRGMTPRIFEFLFARIQAVSSFIFLSSFLASISPFYSILFHSNQY